MPDGFRFAVKMPREITHFRRLIDAEEPLSRFLSEVDALGQKRDGFAGGVVCEPHHPSWFRPEADGLLADFQIAHVAVAPTPMPEAGQPGGWSGLLYYRLHGSPQIYSSDSLGHF